MELLYSEGRLLGGPELRHANALSESSLIWRLCGMGEVRLRECEMREGMWRSKEGKLLHEDTTKFWTEKSEVSWLVTVAASIGVPRQARACFGKDSRHQVVGVGQAMMAVQEIVVHKDRVWDVRMAGVEQVRERLVGEKGWSLGRAAEWVKALEVSEEWKPARADGPEVAAGDGDPEVVLREYVRAKVQSPKAGRRSPRGTS